MKNIKASTIYDNSRKLQSLVESIDTAYYYPLFVIPVHGIWIKSYGTVRAILLNYRLK